MFRRLLTVVGLMSLTAVLLPTSPASASNEGLAVAAITGNVTVDKGPCTITPKKLEHSLLPSKPGSEVTFNQVAMLGAFSNYIGVVTAPAGINACSASHAVLPPPLNALSGWGRIGGGAFEGDNALTGKCVRGGLLIDPDKGWSGDYVQAGVLALVKFDIFYETGNLVAGDCLTPKESVEEIDCIAAIAVAPLGNAGVGNVDPVAGTVVCHPILPSNKNDKL